MTELFFGSEMLSIFNSSKVIVCSTLFLWYQFQILFLNNHFLWQYLEMITWSVGLNFIGCFEALQCFEMKGPLKFIHDIFILTNVFEDALEYFHNNKCGVLSSK